MKDLIINLDSVEIKKEQALTFFQNPDAVESIIEKLEQEAKALVFDVNTEKGRKEIASLAYKISRSKTAIDNCGKELVAELKELPKTIDAHRKIVRDRLDALKDSVRAPLTEWEEAIKEADRLANEAKQRQKDHEIAILMDREFDRLKEEKIKEEQERIERLKREAAEKAREQERIKAEVETKKAELELQKAEAERKSAIERQEKAERQAAIEIEQAKKRALEAEEKARLEKERAKIETENAIKRERERIALEAELKAKKLAEEEEERQRNVAHKKKINQQALKCFVENGLDEDVSKKIISLIAKGLINNVTINY